MKRIRLLGLSLWLLSPLAWAGGQNAGQAVAGTTFGRGEEPLVLPRTGAAPARHDSCETAQKISATTESVGIDEEHAWTWANYPGAVWRSQALVQCPNGPADRITLATTQGEEIVYFDIAQFLGNFGD